MDGSFSPGTDPIVSHIPPAGFVAANDGIYLEKTSKDGDITLEWLCSPIAVIARGRNTQSKGWCRQIELVDADGVVHQWHVPEKDLSGSFNKILSGLRDRGLQFTNGRAARNSLSDLLMRWEPKRRYYTTDRLGWVDGTCTNFVLGNKRVLGEQEMVFLNDAVPSGAPMMHQSGTLDEWRAEVASRCSGNPILLASVSLAFGGPLVEFLGRESAGLHLRGGSSSGKTTCAKAAVSVWGSPKLMKRWRTTANALEGIAATCNGSLLALDEIAEVSARDVGSAVYMLGNGEGKSRSTPVGAPQAVPAWSLMILSTGEISLADKMAEVGKSPMAGQDVRLIDVAADTRRHRAFDVLHGEADSGVFAGSIKSATSMCFGVAGPAFVEKLIYGSVSPEKARRMLDVIISDWKLKLEVSVDGPTVRVLGHFALIGLAGLLATDFGITGWRRGESISAAYELAKEWVEAQERPAKGRVDAAVERTREYLVAHSETHFQRAGRPPLSDIIGYRDDNWFYIPGDTWNVIHAGLIPTEEAQHLASGGWLVHGDGRNIQSKSPNWIPGRPRTYKVRADIVDVPTSAA